ncbi:MAG TPA: leucine-rich repeat domain-containing protein [Candidatus Limnocylindrales bacterium]|nr:leucine-rich repeat domain-containing protein [Candidatus Limnocylindrales bacterium]
MKIDIAVSRITEARRTRAKTLDLSGLGLTEVPSELSSLTQLARLNLGHNQLTAFPAELSSLTQLTELNLGHNQLTALPAELSSLTQLTELNLDHNPLKPPLAVTAHATEASPDRYMVSHGRWFVSAGSNVDLSPLMSDLQRRGADPYVLSDVAELGSDVLQSLRQAIARADQVLLVVGRGTISSTVMFEAGIAVGMDKPLIVIADPHIKLPYDLPGVLTVRARPDDLEAVGFALDQAQGRNVRRSQKAAATGRSLGQRIDGLLVRLRAAEPINESYAIALLKEALDDSGVIAAEGGNTDQRFDLGVWSDDLDSIAANPLLIEVKRKLHRVAVDQAHRYLAESPTARAALIVSLVPVDREVTERLRRSGQPVWVILLRDLLERMRSESFAEVVRDLRNRAAHGALP